MIVGINLLFMLLESADLESPRTRRGKSNNKITPKTKSRRSKRRASPSPVRTSESDAETEKRTSRNTCNDQSPPSGSDTNQTPKKRKVGWPKGVKRGSPVRKRGSGRPGRPAKVKGAIDELWMLGELTDSFMCLEKNSLIAAARKSSL